MSVVAGTIKKKCTRAPAIRATVARGNRGKGRASYKRHALPASSGRNSSKSGRDVARSITAVVRTLALRLVTRWRIGGALPFGRVAPVAQANDIVGIGAPRFGD